jgi:hypothetical protein
LGKRLRRGIALLALALLLAGAYAYFIGTPYFRSKSDAVV